MRELKYTSPTRRRMCERLNFPDTAPYPELPAWLERIVNGVLLGVCLALLVALALGVR